MTRQRIVFLVNGTPASPMGTRARSLAERLQDEFDIQLLYRPPNRVYAIFWNIRQLARFRPALCYVFDIGFSGILAAGIYHAFSRCRVIVDTGDSILELGRAMNRSPLGLWLTNWLENFAFSIADRVVVRSHPHQERLALQEVPCDVIPDGVDLGQFYPKKEDALRAQLGLDHVTVIGILGTLTWNDRLEFCYGVEVVEVIHRLRDRAIKGLVIGDGTGLAKLKERCAALGIEDRVVFVGRIPYDELPRYLNLMHICISTQTNDPVGQVRTSGKLPLYLACGNFVLATDVGEAARVLPSSMLVPYHGTIDMEYPGRLVERIQSFLERPQPDPQEYVAIARSHFDYDVLARRLRLTLHQVLAGKASITPDSLDSPPENRPESPTGRRDDEVPVVRSSSCQVD